MTTEGKDYLIAYIPFSVMQLIKLRFFFFLIFFSQENNRINFVSRLP